MLLVQCLSVANDTVVRTVKQPCFLTDILYVNDVVEWVDGVGVSLYADDTAFYLNGNDPTTISDSLSRAADEFHNWCNLNRLTLNLNKCKTMLFSTLARRRRSEFIRRLNIKINGTLLPLVNEYKYLGLIIDDALKFTKHINMIKKSITYRMFILRKVRWQLGFRDSLLLYKSGILTFYDQGDIFFHAGNKDQLKGLQTLQNKSLRIIFGKKDWPGTNVAHKRCNLLKIDDRRKLSLVKFAHQNSHNPLNLKEHSRHELRSNKRILLKENPIRSSKYEKSFIVASVRLWNGLSEELKSIFNTYAFKTRVKKELLQGNINFPE